MKLFFLLLWLLLIQLHARIIVDDYGRSVKIPSLITKIYAASPPLTMSLLAFDSKLISALNSPFKEDQKPYAGAAFNKSVAGGFFGQGQTPNFELLASSKPDVILMWGKMKGAGKVLSKLKMLGIPVLLVRNDSINDLVSQFELYAKLTGNKKRAEELINYTKETLNLFASLQLKLAKSKRVHYYFAEGIDGLSSECDGSFHLEPFNYAGAINVLRCKMSSNYGMEKISMENILLADPDVIVAMEPAFVKDIYTNPNWKNLKAVQNKKVFTVPSIPFNYITRPPSFMRLLGIRWLIHTFYPSVLESSSDEEVKRFNKLFFGITQ